MTREQLAHVLRAAATIVEDRDILVIGSQAILGTYSDDVLPEEATMSIEVDVAFWEDPTATKADLVDGVIGEGSGFHEMYGYYGQGVEVATATLPAGWRDRVVRFDPPDADPSVAACLDAHDLVVSKLVAGREKDLSFAAALIRSELIDPAILLDRTALLDGPEAVRGRVRSLVQRCARG